MMPMPDTGYQMPDTGWYFCGLQVVDYWLEKSYSLKHIPKEVGHDTGESLKILKN